ncbi:LysR family transcriptional regulator [Bordetella sp. BOR01]|uniref:LysR family transcriptional regulator n=1 Tax=Bordetella sp. BOR01 TaxID=2854779 RepID=UPI001C493755|nr:LysR family transcriptional regulator [Bordetella sp. BOR01]MBV7483288.1 LysR family transcriptional regulator [Bordetella sp. BOR01]
MQSPTPPSPITTRWKIFARVAQLGSLTKAATVMDMQQSAISMQLSTLERECGERLFSRTGRGVVLTSLGERVFTRVQGLLNEADHLVEDILASSHVPTGSVRVGVVSSLAHPFVSRLFRASLSRHPRVRLEISEGFSGQIDEWVSTGVVDIGIVHRYGKQHPAGAEKLFDGPSCLVSKGKSASQAMPLVPFTELNMLPLVLPGLPSGLRMQLEQHAKRKKIALNIVMEANSLAVVKDVVSGGGFYTILPFQAVHREVATGLLKVAKITTPSITRTAALLTTTQKPLSFAARETMKLVRETAQDLVISGLWDKR